MRLASLTPAAFALVLALAAAPPRAAAAPQILALISTDGPIAMQCEGGACTALLTTLCLQRDRTAPAERTPYEPAGLDAFKLVLIGPDGAERTVSAVGLVRLESARSFMAVRAILPQAALAELGAVKVAVAVGAGVSLVPRPVAGDPNPLTERELAAVRTLRSEAAWMDDPGDARGNVARMTSRLVNRMAADGTADATKIRAAYDSIVAANAGRPGTEMFARAFQQCEGQRAWRVDGRDTRQCIEYWHDMVVIDANVRYWQQSGAGS